MLPAATSTTPIGSEKRELLANVLQQAVDRIVSAVHRDRIILFGSAARGTMGANSDVDLLVIKQGATAKRSLMAEIYRQLRGVPEAFDIVVATPE
jgi:predicted nucleotidyltransferase